MLCSGDPGPPAGGRTHHRSGTVLLTYGYARSLGGAGRACSLPGCSPCRRHTRCEQPDRLVASLTPMLASVPPGRSIARCRGGRPRAVARRGTAPGLALQAHPSFVALLPGFPAFFLLRGRHLLRGPHPYLAVLAFVAAFSNVLVYNLQSGFGGLRSISQQYPGEELGSSVYLENSGRRCTACCLTLASSVDPTRRADRLRAVRRSSSACERRGRAVPWLAADGLPLRPWWSSSRCSCCRCPRRIRSAAQGSLLMPLVPLVYVVSRSFPGIRCTAPVASGTVWLRRAALLMLGGALSSLLRLRVRDARQRLHQRAAAGSWPSSSATFGPASGSCSTGCPLRGAARIPYAARAIQQAGWRSQPRRRGVWRSYVSGPPSLRPSAMARPAGVREAGPAAPAADRSHRSILRARDPAPDGGAEQGIGLYRVSAEGAALLAHDARPGCADLLTN